MREIKLRNRQVRNHTSLFKKLKVAFSIMWLLIFVFCTYYQHDVEDKKEDEDKEKDEKDLNLTSEVEVDTIISDGTEVVEMSSEIEVKEKAEERKDADVIKSENSTDIQE